MGAKSDIHNIRDIFPNRDLLMEGANPVLNNDGTFNIRNVTIIKAGLSENGNFYPESVLEKATPLFKGTSIRTDHDSLFKPASVKDVVGVIEEAWYNNKDKVIKAHVKFSSTAEDIMTKVKEGIIGDVSINARGKTLLEKIGGKVRRRVQEIIKVFSVDLVCEAAAGGTLHEEFRQNLLACERMKEKLMELENLTEEELRSARPELIEAIESKAREKYLKEGDIKDKKKDDTSDDEKRESLTEERIANIVKEQMSAIFKERDDKADKEMQKNALNEAINQAIDDILKESDVADDIKLLLKEGLVAFASKSYKSIEDIDSKKLSEERDAILDKFVKLAEKLGDGDPVKPKPGKKPAGQKTRLVDYV